MADERRAGTGEALVSGSADHAVVLRCLPVQRCGAMSATLVDSPRSVVWSQAANRLPARRGRPVWVRGVGGASGEGTR